MNMSEPSPWVARFLPGVAPGGTILDVACGSGRHLRHALTLELRVVGLDRDVSALADLGGRPDVEIIPADLEAGGPLPTTGRQFEGVVVTNYLWRPLLPNIAGSVAPNGVLIYETFASAHARLGGRPSNPDFLLQNNELVEVCIVGGLTIIAFEQVHLAGERARIVQRIAAVGNAHPWTSAPPIAT